MEHIIAKLLHDFEQGNMSRRQLIQSLALTTAVAGATDAPAAPVGANALKVINFNHISYHVADYAKTRDFYANLLGMKVSEDDGKHCRLSFGDNSLAVRGPDSVGHSGFRPSHTPLIDHIGYTIANWDKEKEAIRAELKHRGLKVTEADTKRSFHILDPDGFEVQLGGTSQ